MGQRPGARRDGSNGGHGGCEWRRSQMRAPLPHHRVGEVAHVSRRRREPPHSRVAPPPRCTRTVAIIVEAWVAEVVSIARIRRGMRRTAALGVARPLLMEKTIVVNSLVATVSVALVVSPGFTEFTGNPAGAVGRTNVAPPPTAPPPPRASLSVFSGFSIVAVFVVFAVAAATVRVRPTATIVYC